LYIITDVAMPSQPFVNSGGVSQPSSCVLTYVHCSLHKPTQFTASEHKACQLNAEYGCIHNCYW